MLQKINKVRQLLIILVFIELSIVIALSVLGYDLWYFVTVILVVVQIAMYIYLADKFDKLSEEQAVGVREILGNTAKDAYLYGGIGMVAYDDNHVITWMSDLFYARGINRVGKKVLAWIPEAEAIISGDSDTAEVQLDEKTYEITKKEEEPVLFFKDITEKHNYELAYEEERPVIGMASLDNYEESTQYEDEAAVSNINVAVRTPLTEYCKDHGILLRRINNYRYLLILNEKIFSDLAADHFSILNTVRKAAVKQEVSITLSMAFAMGTDNFGTLDEMVINLMDLAQTRGGDQVAVQRAGEEVKYFGGSSEAIEKRSRVRVRVMAHSLRELIGRSSNVIIVGHKEQDFDCMGAALGVSYMAKILRKQVCIIEKTGGIEGKLKAVLEANREELENEVSFVTESEALNQLLDKTLVIMVDHHNIKQSNGSKVLEQAKNVAVIDHHRRSTEMGVKPIFLYIEAGASSACELITELIPYVSSHIEISELAATIMLTGMTIDTNHFVVRTGARTYDAASTLRRMGADPQKVNEYLKDSYSEFALKSSIMAMSKNYPHQVIVTPVKGKAITRSLMSQCADSLLQIQNVNAVFVIANTDEDQTAISARSNGKVNVQVIMEALHGGGHMTAAAMQRAKCNIDDVEKELAKALENYFMEVGQDESHSEN